MLPSLHHFHSQSPNLFIYKGSLRFFSILSSLYISDWNLPTTPYFTNLIRIIMLGF